MEIIELQKRFKRLFKRIIIKISRKHPKIIIRDGIRWEVDLNEEIDKSIYLYGYFEKGTYEALRKFIKEGMVVFDIGANIGAHTLHMSKLVGENGKVYAFEPMIFVQKKLNRNISLNNVKNVVIESFALNDAVETRGVNFRSSWLSGGGVNGQSQIIQDVKFTTLDNYSRLNKINRIDLIKIDVDGYDYRVLSGSREILQTHSPIIIFELCDYTLKKQGDSAEKLYNFLTTIGYSIFDESNNDKYSDYFDIMKSGIDLSKNSINLIAIKNI
ncbi:MAG: FkbM family methyltransferase [Bacteroidota bacterium]|nr:FkbM family methyltransferase [Bacteroidota bacterium]